MASSIGILGGKGMLGSDLGEFFSSQSSVDSISKENYSQFVGKSYDVLINANGNSRRFWANENPIGDFEASTLSVYKSLLDFKFKKYIYISSSDVYPDHSSPDSTSEEKAIDPKNLSPYGFHKFLSESIVKSRTEDFLIIRCSMILGKNLKKGPVYDILQNQPLFISENSRLQMITTQGIAGAVSELIGRNFKNEIFNIGGIGAVSFRNIGQYFNRQPSFAKEAEEQIYEMNISKFASLNLAHLPKTSEEYLKEYISSIN